MKRSSGANSLPNVRPNPVPSKSEAPNTHQKALEVNLDPSIVTNRLTGNFPGSPIELDFAFTLDGDKIASLEILS